jgi:hypothetical protein
MFQVFGLFLSAKSNLICTTGGKSGPKRQISDIMEQIVNILYMINLIDIQRLAVKRTLI